MNSHEVFIHSHQGCFAGTGAIVRLPQCQWSKPDGYGKISQCITTTKHSKAKCVCIFLGIYCTSYNRQAGHYFPAMSYFVNILDKILFRQMTQFWYIAWIFRSVVNGLNSASRIVCLLSTIPVWIRKHVQKLSFHWDHVRPIYIQNIFLAHIIPHNRKSKWTAPFNG